MEKVYESKRKARDCCDIILNVQITSRASKSERTRVTNCERILPVFQRMDPMTLQRAYRIATRIFSIFGAFVFCSIVAFAVTTSWKMPIHQFNLWKLEKNFQALAPSHPTDSMPVLTFKKFGGLFSSAANSCDYFVGEFRTSADSREDIREYYRNLSVQVRFGDEGDFWIYYPWSELYGELLHLLNTFPDEQNDLYAIFVSEKVRPPYADLRCF